MPRIVHSAGTLNGQVNIGFTDSKKILRLSLIPAAYCRQTEIDARMKSVREVEEFIIHTNRIKRIEQGEALVISRTVPRGCDQLNTQRTFIESQLKEK